MKVSVVIPVYNEEKYIRKCLLSLLHQEVMPDEIIVVNNNCTDRTLAIVKRFKKVTIVDEEQQGMIWARNKGFDTAKYEIIARTDADAVLPLDWIKKIKYHFENLNIDGLAGPVSMSTKRANIEIFDAQVADLYIKSIAAILGHPTFIGPNMIFTKKIWNIIRDKVCTNDKKVHEDIDMAIHIARSNGVIYYDPTLIVKASARRVVRKPHSFFIEYPIRWLQTIAQHKITI